MNSFWCVNFPDSKYIITLACLAGTPLTQEKYVLNWTEICKDSEVLKIKNVKCLKINGQTGESRTKINRNVTYMYTLKVQCTENMQIVLKSIYWQNDIVWQY